MVASCVRWLQVYGSMNSLGVFLGQEFVRFNGLIEVMKGTLNDLQRAIKVGHASATENASTYRAGEPESRVACASVTHS